MATSPTLLYLTIYNPTLPVVETEIQSDDEDAQEQAHILFYTSRDRAATRDKMLRQVGLAKAILHFSDIFADEPCTSVRSQMHRMILLSPEPGYWIQACVDLARIPRIPLESTVRAKSSKSASQNIPTSYEYVDASVQDIDLRASVLAGYDLFRLKYGSFSSILENLGREALELQLERHFTPWAWSWSLDEVADFSTHFGVQLHSMHRIILPTLDEWASLNATEYSHPLLLLPPYIVPSTAYSFTYSRSALPQFLLNMVTTSTAAKEVAKPSEDVPPPATNENSDESPPESDAKTSTPSNFLNLPPIAMMDARKWNWPGYLTFGKGQARRTGLGKASMEEAPVPLESEIVPESAKEESPAEDAKPPSSPGDAQVNPEDLEEAMSTPGVTIPELSERTPSRTPTPTAIPLPQIATFNFYLAENNTPYETKRRKVSQLTLENISLVLVHSDDEGARLGEDSEMLESVSTLLTRIANILNDNQGDGTPSPTVSTLLQQKDKTILSSDPYSRSFTEFSSRSGQHYNAEYLQTIYPEITEIFSRTQNPQHFYGAKSCANQDRLFVEVCRKETSLSDIDNIVASSIKKLNDA